MQLLFALGFLFLPLSYIVGQDSVVGTLASLQVGSVELTDPAVGLSAILAARSAAWTLLAGMLLPGFIALLLGPVFCAWVCPWGLLSELIAKPLRKGARRENRSGGSLRWFALGGTLLLGAATGLPIAATISAPALITELPLELIFLGAASTGTLSLLGALLLLELVAPRLWCRRLCPSGSLLALIRSPKTLRIGWSQDRCVGDSRCADACPWDIDPRHIESHDGCTNCCACLDVCPHGALLTEMLSRREGR